MLVFNSINFKTKDLKFYVSYAIEYISERIFPLGFSSTLFSSVLLATLYLLVDAFIHGFMSFASMFARESISQILDFLFQIHGLLDAAFMLNYLGLTCYKL